MTDRRYSVPASAGALAFAGWLSLAGPAHRAQADDLRMIQWFETSWSTIERRMPDLYLAGYDAMWLPPPSLAASFPSPAYDVFDRFHLGTPQQRTIYGTEATFRAMVAASKRAGTLVFVDSIMNHNSPRNGSPQFIADGGYPGFVLGLQNDFWGDFNDGTQQSTDPNGPNYNLWNGDLLGLIDIDQGSNHFYIRHPIADHPRNIPPGTVRNRPDPANTRFYPDLSLQPMVFTNPSNGRRWTIYPFNTQDPSAGDPVPENATGLLMRWTQWMLDDLQVDGFRLDAAKHIPQWFWNDYWDAAVHQRWVTASGSRRTPYSFGEIVDSNAFTLTYTRIDNFANRDALDLNGAGQLRNSLFSRGFASWNGVLNSHLDNQDDGFNNGSRGVFHVFSHDNGSTGDGGSAPGLPGADLWALPQHAYIALRPGNKIVYHNSREMHRRFPSANRFWPREGTPPALGLGADDLVVLNRITRSHARGEFNILNGTDPVNTSRDDVLVFERRTRVGNGSVGNLLVAVNDRYDGGVQQRNVLTSFAPGTRLHELTGNAADPSIDPDNAIPEKLVVGQDRRVVITIPNNRSSRGVTHHRGFVAYGPAAPSGVLGITGIVGTIPADPIETPSDLRRLTPIDIVSGDSIDVILTTSKTDPQDPNWDDNALFRLNAGFRDDNGNGVVDIGEDHPTIPGYEQFTDLRQPLFGSNRQNGLYRQTLDASTLPEGYNYVSVVAFRHRSDGGEPILTDFRRVFYLDNHPPRIDLTDPGRVVRRDTTFFATTDDPTVTEVHILLNLPPETDPIPLLSSRTRMQQPDRFQFTRSFFGLERGPLTITLVALEESGRANIRRYEGLRVGNPIRRQIDSADLAP